MDPEEFDESLIDSAADEDTEEDDAEIPEGFHAVDEAEPESDF